MAKIVIVSHYAKSLVNLRSELIKKMASLGHNVIALAPDKGFESELKSIGAKFFYYPLKRTGINPFAEIKTSLALIKIMKTIKPDVVFSYSTKPVIYASLAARIIGVRHIYSLITGLGFAFVNKDKKRLLFNALLKVLYRVALKINNIVFFQNPDDMMLFLDLGIIKNKNAELVNGSGVNLEKYNYAQVENETISFLLISRLIWDKGIREYIEAARIIKRKYSDVSFYLLGPYDSNPAAIRKKDIDRWIKEGIINYLGEVDDVRPYIINSSVFVLPSYYREGIPRSILEAMSIGRPVITTDSPGCRETVEDGVNGFLVPTKDSKKLAEKMEEFILNPSLIKEMGKKARSIAEEKFDVNKVNRKILKCMKLINSQQ